ncbi:hypothetical protein [Vibrio superstes]|uniref:hypothetical protein n=1 Tax=Vibrio superstes TaxID=198815 RepID=UPI0013C3335A|nr:hypothetical protein [Vibrio superstes]
MSEIILSQVAFFLQSLMKDLKPDGSRRLTNKRINNILYPLVTIVSLASDDA